jgi:ribosomal protein S27E
MTAMLDRPLRPCVYPGCRDSDGNAHTTRDVICDRSRYHYRRLLDWIGWDYVTIRATMPKPVSRGARTRSSGSKVYGHPAEWASDTLAEIANLLNGWEDTLREALGHDPAVHPGHVEHRRVALGLNYLTNWFDQLCTFEGAADAAAEFEQLHHGIRRALGHTGRSEFVKLPCPQCEMLSLFRTISAGRDEIDCRSCGAVVTKAQYGLYTRILVDEHFAKKEPTSTCA